MGFWEQLTNLIPGPLDDALVSAVQRAVSSGGGGSDSPSVPAATLLPATAQTTLPVPSSDSGWFEGSGQWYDPGEWGTTTTTTPVSTTNGNGGYPGCKITLPAQVRQRYYAPPGYVIVRPPTSTGAPGAPVAMLKRVAMTCGLWKAPSKPPIAAKDWKALRRAAAVTRKLDTVVRTANKVTGRPDLRRVRRSSGK